MVCLFTIRCGLVTYNFISTMFLGQFLDSIKILAHKFLREDTHMLFIIIIIIGPFRYCEVVLRKICYKRFWNWKTENIFCIVRLP